MVKKDCSCSKRRTEWPSLKDLLIKTKLIKDVRNMGLSIEEQIENARDSFDDETIDALLTLNKVQNAFIDLTNGLEKRGIDWAHVIKEERK